LAWRLRVRTTVGAFLATVAAQANSRTVSAIAFVFALGGPWLAGCGRAAATAASPPPPEVSVVHVNGENATMHREYPARTYAPDLVEVRGRVDGYVDRRTFDIGSDVRAGQVLYVLDVRPYEAEVERARGALAQATADIAQAEANQVKARQDVERLEPLVKEDTVARQDLDNALAARRSGEALVEARKATLEANRAILRTAELNLEYATIRAPIGGRVGDSLLKVGGLVTKSSASPLTTIVPLDPIWVRFQVSEGENRSSGRQTADRFAWSARSRRSCGRIPAWNRSPRTAGWIA